eukprot:6192395-Pleurochrysis_carterae.AAC.8
MSQSGPGRMRAAPRCASTRSCLTGCSSPPEGASLVAAGPRVRYGAPTPPHVRDGMELAVSKARADARRREDDKLYAALMYKVSKYEYY